MKLLFALLVVILSCMALASAGDSDVCQQQMAKNGNGVIQCMGYFPSWTYDAAANTCVQFVFGGCQGNGNRFESEQLCRQVCVV